MKQPEPFSAERVTAAFDSRGDRENDPWNRFWQSQKNAKYNNNFYGVFMLIQTATVMSKVPEYCDIPLFLTLLETFYTKTYHAGIRRFLVMIEVTVSEI